MAELLKSNPRLLYIFKLCRALPLLPADRIEGAFAEIVKQDTTNEMKPFLDYFEKQWIKKETPENFSVFGCKYRTNNPCEIYHAYLKKKTASPNCSIWVLITILQDDELTHSRQYSQRMKTPYAPVRVPQSVKSHIKTQYLLTWWDRLENHVISDLYFLENIHTLNADNNLIKELTSSSGGSYFEVEDLKEEEEAAATTPPPIPVAQPKINVKTVNPPKRQAKPKVITNVIKIVKPTKEVSTVNKTECGKCFSKINLLLSDKESQFVCRFEKNSHIKICEFCAVKIKTKNQSEN